jgi:hypothetical protein
MEPISNAYKIVVEKPVRDNMVDIRIDGRIILK